MPTITGVPYQPNNPSDVVRHSLVRYVLAQKRRLEDFEYIKDVLSPPRNIVTIAYPGEFKNTKIGIIGGGLAGMSAAFELRKLGFDITIFDALDDRIGGRVYTNYFNEAKTLYGEFGPMRIPVTHETTWHYIKLFGLNTRPFIQNNENAIIYLRETGVRNDFDDQNVMKYIYPKYELSQWERNMPWSQLVFYGYESYLFDADPLIRSELQQIKPQYAPQILYWQRLSIRQALENKGISNPAISMIESLAPFAGENLYSSFIDYLEKLYTLDFSILYEIVGGLVNLPLAFYNSLIGRNPKEYTGISQNLLGNIKWKSGRWVTGIYKKGYDGKITLASKNKNARDLEYEAFDYIISAIPFSSLRNVEILPPFSNIKMQAIKEVNYVNAEKSLFLFKKRFWEEGGPNQRIIGGGTYTDLPITMVYYPSDHVRVGTPDKCSMFNCYEYPDTFYQNLISSPNEPGVLLASYSLNLDSTRLYNQNEELRVKGMLRELEKIHGLTQGYLDSILVDHKIVEWNSQPAFRGAFCFLTPDQKRIFSYPMGLPEYENRVFFAGEHIAAKHSWMQGALKTGMDAANNVAEACRNQKKVQC